MEYTERQSRPPAIGALLRQQLKEQSEHCDVTIKVGQWVKRFHWCVLVASPFFEAFYRNRNCIEQSTGIIELHCQSSISVVEDSIMFLYGKMPKIHMNNISDLLELAEFFLLPTLKAHCVKWLNAQEASCVTNFQVLHLASLYDLKLPFLKKYMRENMIALLDKDDAVSLEQDTLVDLINDKDLTYVPIDVWFRFLVKWTNADPGRDAYFPELFSLLDLSDIDQELYQTICNNPLSFRLGRSTFDKIRSSVGEPAPVVIFPQSYSGDTMACFQPETGNWSNIRIEQDFRRCHMVGVKDKASSILYSFTNVHFAPEITVHDLSNQNQTCPTTKLEDIDGGKIITAVDNFAVAGTTCYLLKRQQVETKKAVETANKTMKSGAFAFGLRAPKSKNKYATILYKGELQEGRTILKPIACFNEKDISYLAVDTQHNIALYIHVHQRAEVIIFNDVQGCLERINLRENGFKSTYNVTFVARETGFLISNSEQLCCITPIQGPSLRERFRVSCVDLPKVNIYMSTYIVCRDVCLRFERIGFSYDYTFSYINVDNLVNTTVEDAEWLTNELPNSCKRNFVDFLGTSAFLISMPKRLLRCSLDCLHCKPVKEGRSTGRVFSPQPTFLDDYEDYDYNDDYDDYDDYHCFHYDSSENGYPYYYNSD